MEQNNIKNTSKDIYGFRTFNHIKLSKVGVFKFLRNEIDPSTSGTKAGLDIVNAYRPASLLSDKNTIDSFDKKAWIGTGKHNFLLAGDKISDPDKIGIRGIVTNPTFNNDALYGDLTLFSDDLKDKIKSGELNDLSLGYSGLFKKKNGVYNGTAYNYIQTSMVGNHLASVPTGRMGSEVSIKNLIGDSICNTFMHQLKLRFNNNNNNNHGDYMSNEQTIEDIQKQIAELATKADDLQKKLDAKNIGDEDEQSIEDLAKKLIDVTHKIRDGKTDGTEKNDLEGIAKHIILLEETLDKTKDDDADKNYDEGKTAEKDKEDKAIGDGIASYMKTLKEMKEFGSLVSKKGLININFSDCNNVGDMAIKTLKTVGINSNTSDPVAVATVYLSKNSDVSSNVNSSTAISSVDILRSKLGK